MRLAKHFPVSGTRVVQRVPEILRLCASRKILHLGCADVPFTVQRGEQLLHRRLSNVTNPALLWGLETSWEGVELLRGMGFDNILHCNAEQLEVRLKEEEFDIILAGEIIEHVANPGMFLDSITKIMSSKTELLLTTTNAFSFKSFLFSLMRKEKVHEDHNYYFSYRTLIQLFQKFNLNCQEVYYYQEIQGAGLSKSLDRILSLSTVISPVLADGLIVRATLNT